MVTSRRIRSKPLIRLTASGPVSNGAVGSHKERNYPDKKYTRSNSDSVILWESLSRQSTGSRPDAGPVPGQDSMAYLEQLYMLHDAGILTDDEFSAARQRLLGS